MARKSNLGGRDVPKPANQGGMKATTPRPPVRGSNGQRNPGKGVMATKPTKSPGSGTRGGGTTANRKGAY